jgi:phosphoribosylformylglycinamidine synthase
MHWEIEVRPKGHDALGVRVGRQFAELGLAGVEVRCSRVYLLEGALDAAQTQRIAGELLADAAIEEASAVTADDARTRAAANGVQVTVLPRPGVMDPAAESVQHAVADIGLPQVGVRTGHRYVFRGPLPSARVAEASRKTLANDAIEQVILGPLPDRAWAPSGSAYAFSLVQLPIRGINDEQLLALSRQGQLSLSLAEMQTIQSYYRDQRREATDVELETIAQTWSEHCSHKTLKGRIAYRGPEGERRYENLLKQTIFAATQELRRRWGADDWCVSVFEDNAGVIRFDDRFHVCFKVETHNRPSAIEPYGGANTGLGGVIRDVLGTGLGGKPVCNTDVFCFAPPDTPASALPSGVLHPRRVMQGVVDGVRDYGNRMGIATVNGAVLFDPRYLGNPLVYCGTVGLIPAGMERKQAKAGDLIVAVGGRTGRDGIHGATFSSAELTEKSEQLSGGAVQIGNAITEKKLLDVILQARDQGLYHAITDCGAGGFSSAVGEMGAEVGAEVHLDRAPLKYEGLTYTEIWISEAQERMVLAVPPEHWPALHALCASEGVEATVLGEFKPTGRLQLFYQGHRVGDLDMRYLHEGRPPVVRQAQWQPPAEAAAAPPPLPGNEFAATLLKILASWNVCSKEWIVRQYDHEVQGGSVLKPLVGVCEDGPGDAAVVAPIMGSTRGFAVGCGINPRYGDLDPYWMAASAIDEAVRNVVAVGADPSRVALLDNFCWGNTDRPEVLGSLVRAAEACRDVALAYGAPFISGKDSLKNEFHGSGRHIVIPPTLLISALGIVPDVRRCVSMDAKTPGNVLFLLGQTKDERGGSHEFLVRGLSGGPVPKVDLAQAPRIFRALHQAMRQGLIRSCHDLSEGGLAVALAEMCFAGGLGAEVRLPRIELAPEAALFSESNTRFLLEILPDAETALSQLFAGLPLAKLGVVACEPRLKIAGSAGEPLIDVAIEELKGAWQRPITS